ncbi:ribonuclease H-like domain, reverse transcriptase, RNA-dependent DNA polymerase [Tanacetum coccineum]
MPTIRQEMSSVEIEQIISLRVTNAIKDRFFLPCLVRYKSKPSWTKDLNDDLMAMEVQSSSMDLTNAVKTGGGLYPALPTQGTTLARNTPGKSSYDNVIGESSKGFEYPSLDGLNSMLENGPSFIRNHLIILKKWNPDVNLLKEDVGNVPVWVKLHDVLIMMFSEDGLSVIATKLGRSSYARVMIELRDDVELKDNIVVAMPKINGEGFYTCNVRVEYEWKPPRCACCKIFGHTQVECPKNIDLGAGSGEKKKKNKPSQAPKGILVSSKMAFKTNQEYRPVPKKNTANSSGNKNKGVDSTNKVSDSNPFKVLYSVDNVVEMGTNRGGGGVKYGANSSGSSFWNVKNSSTGTTPIMDKIRKITRRFECSHMCLFCRYGCVRMVFVSLSGTLVLV